MEQRNLLLENKNLKDFRNLSNKSKTNYVITKRDKNNRTIFSAYHRGTAAIKCLMQPFEIVINLK